MSTIYRPFPPSRRAQLAALITQSAERAAAKGGADIDHLAELRTALTGRASPSDALKALAAGEPGLEERLRTRILPAILGHARALVEQADPALPLHVAGRPALAVVPRAEVAGWIAHMILGTLPHPSPDHPYVDFVMLLSTSRPAELAKLRCVLGYFDQVADNAPAGRIEIEHVAPSPRAASAWALDSAPLTTLEVFEEGVIEDAAGHRQVDFANAYLGGGVLSGGCVQEEIRFAVAPELLVGMIVSPRMDPSEAIVLRGAPRFTITRGYAFSLAYDGHFEDPAARAEDGTPDVELVAMDALDYRNGDEADQFTEAAMLRELAKARAGFLRDVRALPVATGNWGCGVFRGDPALKALLQWLAASAEGRSVRYSSFGDRRVGDLAAFVASARARFGTVSGLFRRLFEVVGGAGLAGRSGGPGLYARLLA